MRTHDEDNGAYITTYMSCINSHKLKDQFLAAIEDKRGQVHIQLWFNTITDNNNNNNKKKKQRDIPMAASSHAVAIDGVEELAMHGRDKMILSIYDSILGIIIMR